MSAPSPLCRTCNLVLALAVFLTAWAHAAPDSAATDQGKPLPARSTHSRAGRSHPRREAHAVRSHSTRRRAAAREPEHAETWQKSSRAAGLEIRRKLDRDRMEAERRRREARRRRVEARRDEAPIAPRSSESSRAAENLLLPMPADSERFNDEAALRLVPERFPPPLRGSLALLERQDERLEADGLEPIEDERDLAARIAHHLLVPLPTSSALTVNDQLSAQHRYCRPWTAAFLTDLARAHAAVFHRPLEITSAVRPASYQERLMRINGNAAPAAGDVFSPHIMGATIDIGKKPMSFDEIEWMRRHLLALELTGKIDVEEEFEQACFHITVYKSYAPPRRMRAPRPEAGQENNGRSQSDDSGSTAATGTM